MNLKFFLEKYGTETSNNFQLLHWAKQLKIKNFHVFMRDEIKEMQNSCKSAPADANLKNL